MIVPAGATTTEGWRQPKKNVTEADETTSVDGSRGPDYMHRTLQDNEVE